jgi:glycolate oxidase
MNISGGIYRELCRITGKEFCSNKIEDRICYAYDAINRNLIPDIIISPASSVEIAEIMKIACREKIPVIPRGAGSGTTGGSVAVRGGIVLVLTRMNAILEIDRQNFTATAQSGVVTADFAKAVEAKGMFYPPDPSSAAFSTLGGNLAECAGGPRAVKYGVTRDYVLGLEFVSPEGKIMKTGVKTSKGVVGYDITRLLIGSEGTLGIITQGVFRLVPVPESVQTVTAVFKDMKSAAQTVSEIIMAGVVPRAIEFLDNESIKCAESYSGIGLSVDAGAMLIIEADGRNEETRTCMEEIKQICNRMGAVDFKEASDKQETATLWSVRKAVSPALYMYGPDKINEDIVVPRSKIPEIVSRIEQFKKETGLMMVCFGHAGDGNIHFNIMLDKSNKTELKKAEAVVEKVFDLVIAMGGTLSGEHGVGISKQKYISKEIGFDEQALMKNLKKTFDPFNILNPGKIFTQQ